MSRNANSQIPVTTPCVGICSTVFGDTVCRGCKRYADEIIEWNRFSQDEKQAVDARLQAHLMQILGDKVHIEDEQRFTDALIDNNIRYMKNRPSLCWVNDLLRTNVLEQQGFEPFGLVLAEEYAALSIAEFRDLIDNELLVLSEAHHQRFIQTGKA